MSIRQLLSINHWLRLLTMEGFVSFVTESICCIRSEVTVAAGVSLTDDITGLYAYIIIYASSKCMFVFIYSSCCRIDVTSIVSSFLWNVSSGATSGHMSIKFIYLTVQSDVRPQSLCPSLIICPDSSGPPPPDRCLTRCCNSAAGRTSVIFTAAVKWVCGSESRRCPHQVQTVSTPSVSRLCPCPGHPGHVLAVSRPCPSCVQAVQAVPTHSSLSGQKLDQFLLVTEQQTETSTHFS